MGHPGLFFSIFSPFLQTVNNCSLRVANPEPRASEATAITTAQNVDTYALMIH